MTTDWILRIGDGHNFMNSSRYKIWGIQSTHSFGKHFLKNVKQGDRLWFVTSKSNGKLFAVATYRTHIERIIGPLFDITKTDKELGWIGNNWKSDTEIHYTDLYGLSNCELLTHIKGTTTIRKYDNKCLVNLPVEYSYIIRYSKVSIGL
jgi:hypothetical protein